MSGFEVTPDWCARAKRSVDEGALEQLARRQAEVDRKREFWRGYIAAIEELEEHIKRADEADR